MAALAVSLVAVAGLGGAVQVAVMGTLGERVGVFPAVAFSTKLQSVTWGCSGVRCR